MNGLQIERMLQMIDENVLADQAAIRKYIQENRALIVQSLRETGTAKIPTSTGGYITIGETVAA